MKTCNRQLNALVKLIKSRGGSMDVEKLSYTALSREVGGIHTVEDFRHTLNQGFSDNRLGFDRNARVTLLQLIDNRH